MICCGDIAKSVFFTYLVTLTLTFDLDLTKTDHLYPGTLAIQLLCFGKFDSSVKAGIVMNVFSDTHTDNQINVISVQISTKIAQKRPNSLVILFDQCIVDISRMLQTKFHKILCRSFQVIRL